MKFAAFLFVYLCVVCVCSKALGHEFVMGRDLKQIRGKFCGPNLSTALSVVCRGKYNSPRPKQQKKSSKSNLIIVYLTILIIIIVVVYEDDEEFSDYPFVLKRNALNFLTDEISKRGVVEECCLDSCSLQELQSYCR